MFEWLLGSILQLPAPLYTFALPLGGLFYYGWSSVRTASKPDPH